ncbi:flagellin [Herbaspirillum seropedicae]|uniref:Flagellin n=2 Tax=Herbaspirillum seropedicae TaxID=964 RepID=D8IT11_HERSS|nr:flagellin [Herbaspirillum seropedicae]ADJ63570.1 flagellin protein; filament structural protein [Herbaspirillum seropedicae SmR1]AKN65598.1 flagellin [Herbaspirillum seropedicae]AON54397.1 flagellin filament structural protein [Herbaspirillum seropedicae]MDR6394555.1 flagellin [Herbaspirillum seropedicae]NQE28757.1 flagellin [Herbaspirillum seropedicae]
MASVINTNIPSLNTQRNLNASQSSLNTSIQRLSSGLRVNSAKDDAAGLAIADRMNSQVKGLAVAQRNANDGISMAQTAEGALSTVGDNLQRMRELAVQAANGTNSAQDRKTLNDEYTQLSQEVFRVLNGTSFNGQNLFTGTGQGASAGTGSDSANVSASLTLSFQVGANVSDNKLNDQITITLDDLSNNGTMANVIGTSAKGLIGLGNTSGVSTAQATYTSAKAALDNLFATGSSLSSSALASSAVTLQATVDSAKLALDQAVAAPSAQSDAQKAIQNLDKAISLISSKRAEFGAVQNRFSAVISNLQVSSENITSSRSRIMDTDYAQETANLTRAQILQQAGNAMLSQANSAPQQVLSLLK